MTDQDKALRAYIIADDRESTQLENRALTLLKFERVALSAESRRRNSQGAAVASVAQITSKEAKNKSPKKTPIKILDDDQEPASSGAPHGMDEK